MQFMIRYLTAITFLFIMNSCKTPKQLQYFDGPLDTTRLARVKVPEPIIQKGDLLSIIVFSDNNEASAPYNQPMTTTTQAINPSAGLSAISGNTVSPASGGYVVDQEGFIQFPRLGQLRVEGLSKGGLVNLLDSKLKDNLLQNPFYSIRFLNYKITILGEVTRPAVYSIPSEKVNILEALGMAGDITVFGLKDDILVIREGTGKREIGKINVSDPLLVESRYYHLIQNDIIIVRASAKKPTASEQQTTRNLARVATVAAIITSIALIVNIFK